MPKSKKRSSKRLQNVKKDKGRKGRKTQGKPRQRSTPQRTSRKARPPKVRSRKAVRNATNRKGNRVSKARHRPDKRKKPLGRVAYKAKVSIQAKGRQRASRGKVKTPGTKAQVTARHPKTGNEIKLGFKGVKSIKGKIRVLTSSKAVKGSIARQLKTREGRPPKGAVVIVEDKDGNTLAFPTPPDMVVNEANLQSFIEECVNKMADDHKAWQRFEKGNKRLKKAKGQDDEGLLEKGGDNDPLGPNPYGEYNPNGINQITIKFVYGK